MLLGGAGVGVGLGLGEGVGDGVGVGVGLGVGVGVGLGVGIGVGSGVGVGVGLGLGVGTGEGVGVAVGVGVGVAGASSGSCRLITPPQPKSKPRHRTPTTNRLARPMVPHPGTLNRAAAAGLARAPASFRATFCAGQNQHIANVMTALAVRRKTFPNKFLARLTSGVTIQSYTPKNLWRLHLRNSLSSRLPAGSCCAALLAVKK
jgi:hypothetical protein